jgi:hypothetical protein
MASTDPADAAAIARWVRLGRPPIPIAFDERGRASKTITNLVVEMGNPQDAEERNRVVAWVFAHDPPSRP